VECVDGDQEIMGGGATGKHACPGIINEAISLDRGEVRLGMGDECCHELRSVIDPVEPSSFCIGKNPQSRFDQIDVHRRTVEQDLLERDDAIRHRALREHDRHDPL
jgi:hypothetical protein